MRQAWNSKHSGSSRPRVDRIARIYLHLTNDWLASEYRRASERIDVDAAAELPAEIETNAMVRLRQEAHARMLGNGICTGPVELDCRMETICETCAYFDTGPEFVPVLLRQRHHARDHHQHDRADLYDNLIQRAGTAS